MKDWFLYQKVVFGLCVFLLVVIAFTGWQRGLSLERQRREQMLPPREKEQFMDHAVFWSAEEEEETIRRFEQVKRWLIPYCDPQMFMLAESRESEQIILKLHITTHPDIYAITNLLQEKFKEGECSYHQIDCYAHFSISQGIFCRLDERGQLMDGGLFDYDQRMSYLEAFQEAYQNWADRTGRRIS